MNEPSSSHTKYRLAVVAASGNVLLSIRPALPDTPTLGYTPDEAEEVARGILEAAAVARNQQRTRP